MEDAKYALGVQYFYVKKFLKSMYQTRCEYRHNFLDKVGLNAKEHQLSLNVY